MIAARTLAAVVLLSLPAFAGPPALVYYGWGIPETSWVRDHWESMDAAPFDGTAFVVAVDREAWRRGERDVRNQLGWHLFGPRRFSDADVRSALDDLRVARWRRLTRNFVPACINSQPQGAGFSWLDDGRWDGIVQNWRVLAGFAKRAGLRGVILDPEDYGGRIFRHDPTAGIGFDQHRRAVQRRGRELMAAVRDAFPDVTILALYGHTLALADAEAGTLASGTYGLYPAFLDGLLEGAGPDAQVVDGYEFAYGFTRRAQFVGAAREIREDGRALSRLPALYDRHVRVGFGLWLDHEGPARWHPEEPARNHFTPSGWQAAVEAALRTSDGWVWVYSQRPGFFPPQALPAAYVEATEAARRAARR